MKKVNNIFLIFLLGATLFATGCSNGKLFGKKSDCGCPNKKGMVGY